MRSTISSLSILTALALALGACLGSQENGGGSDGEHANALERVRETSTIRIAYANEEPYGYTDESGAVTGEAPEIAKAIFERMGIENVEATTVDFGSLVPGLQAGRYDVIAAGMYITPTRAEKVLFTDPTYRIGEGFLVQEGNPKDLHSYEDVREHDEATLGVVGGTVEQGYASDIGIPDARVKVFQNNPTAAQAVINGQVDAFAGTALTIQTIADKLGEDSGAEIAQPFTDPVIDGEEKVGYGAFAFRKADQALRDAFNKELRGFLGSEEHAALVTPFGFGELTRTDLSLEAVLAMKSGERPADDGSDAADDAEEEGAAEE